MLVIVEPARDNKTGVIPFEVAEITRAVVRSSRNMRRISRVFEQNRLDEAYQVEVKRLLDKGEIVCSCYQVGSKQIEKAIASGICSVDELGGKLKCGTNCGSCLPELKRFIPTVAELSV